MSRQFLKSGPVTGINKNVTRFFDPNDAYYNNSNHPLIAWWDATDNRYMYSDAGSTLITTTNTKCYRIMNKAVPSGGLTTRLGTYVQQTTEADRPTWKTSGSRPGSGTYLEFTGSHFMTATNVSGIANGAGSLTSSTINMSNITMFFVFAPTAATVNDDKGIFSIFDANDSKYMFQVEESDDQIHSIVGDGIARTTTTIDSGINNDTNLQMWYINLKGDVGSGTSLFHKNGLYAGVTNGSGDNLAFDLVTNDSNNQINLGALANTGQNITTDSEMRMKFYEAFIFNGSMTNTVAAGIMQALAEKYDISYINS